MVKVKLNGLTDIDMLLMAKKGIRSEICHIINWYAKANNKYIRDYNENKESSYIRYWEINNSYRWEMSQKLPLGSFKLVEDNLAKIL